MRPCLLGRMEYALPPIPTCPQEPSHGKRSGAKAHPHGDRTPEYRVKFLFCGRPRALRVETSPTCSRISQPRSKSKCFKFMDNVRNHRSPAPGAQRVSEGCMFNINCAPPPRRAARAQTRAARRAPSAHRRRSRPRSRSHSAGCPRVAAGHAASERG